MAEYLGIPLSTETSEEEPVSFQSICNLWVKADYWPLEDAVRILLGIQPAAFRKTTKTDNEPKSFKIVYAFAKNCAGASLNVINVTTHSDIIYVDPKHFLSWAQEKSFPIPSELEIAFSSNPERKKLKRKKWQIEQRNIHRERCRGIASMIWSNNPDLSTNELISFSEILEFGCEGQRYSEKALISWLKDLEPK